MVIQLLPVDDRPSSVRDREVRVELLAYLHHLLAGEAAAGAEFGDRFEVVVLSTRQTPVEHARRRVADVLEAVHHVARDEDDGAGASRRGLVTDRDAVVTASVGNCSWSNPPQAISPFEAMRGARSTNVNDDGDFQKCSAASEE